jgi:hypothetical protein
VGNIERERKMEGGIRWGEGDDVEVEVEVEFEFEV